MNCHNGERYLKQAIDSIYSQKYKDWEIIFFDNNSNDKTQLIARGYNHKLRYFYSDVLLSLGAARNEALARVNGEYIAFLDTDDYWLPDKLEKSIGIMTRNKKIDFFYSNYYRLNGETGRMSLGLKFKQPSGYVFGHFLKKYPVNLQTVLIRRSSLEVLDHYFDPKLELSEEFDLFIRLLFSARAYYESKPLIVYRVHSKMSSIRLIENFPVENRYVIKKILSINPDIAVKYVKNLTIFNNKLYFWEAKAAMHYGNKKQAREILRPTLFLSLSNTILYFASYYSFLWNWVLVINKYIR